VNTNQFHHRAFTLVELLVAIAIIIVLSAVAAPAVWGAYKSSSLAVSANNIRQLAAGGGAYLGDNNYRFWPFLQTNGDGQVWWFGLEPAAHKGKPEGERVIDMSAGPLGAYMPRNIVPDPSFTFTGKPFKPKYKFGYIGVGYNVHLAGETTNGRAIWLTRSNSPPPLRYWDLKNPAETVVFATSAQVYPFRKDAVIEEFYGIDKREVTVHFRHNNQAMVAFANGSAGFLPMDPSTRDSKAPDANVGRFAPKGSKKFLR
jgi:prepilin-type N-terminal cleavage/methylation domain-containing protein